MVNLRTSLRLISGIVLVVGLGGAILIYWTSNNTPNGVLGYEEGGGSVYPIRPEDSRRYLRDMELYGGKANVLMDEFRRWFTGLWRGQSLAFTVGFITVSISLGILYVASHLPSNSQIDLPGENHRGGTG